MSRYTQRDRMLPSLLRKALKLTGRRHLIPFLDGLTYLGRPSQVPFPSELLEQGLAIVLSGLNNTLAVQSNPDWVWPHWVERQISPEGEEFIPTAFNLIKSNLTCRNWTSIGLEDSPREAMLDPVGMLTLKPYGWSVFPYVRIGGRGIFPPRMRDGVTQSLLEGALPAVTTRYQVVNGLLWDSETLALRVRGEEAIAFTHTLRNESERHLSLRFGLALRPYNSLMLGHINRIQFENQMWRVNGHDSLWLGETPDRVVVSDRHHGDPLVSDVLIEGLRSLRSRSGIACGLCEWAVELPAGGERVLHSLAFLGETTERSLGLRGNVAGGVIGMTTSGLTGAPKGGLVPALAEARGEAIARMREAQNEGMSLKLPVPKLEEAFAAIKGHLHVFDDRTHFSPGTFLYHQPWFRDAAFIAAAFDHLGWFARVEEKFGPMLKRQDRHGFFRSQNGEWDSNGQAMWTLVSHIRRGGSPAPLETIHPALMSAARWLKRMRTPQSGTPSPHFGLLPAGFSAEHFGPNDHYYWDNIWGIAGLEAALWSAKTLGRNDDAAWLTTEIEDYRGDMRASMENALRRQGERGLPCSPYRSLDTAAIGNLVAISPLGILPAQAEWVRMTCDWLWHHNVRDGLFFQKIVHTGLNPYLTAQLARAFIALRDARGYVLLEALIAHATSTYTWPEALHPRTFGGCMGDGDHGWSAAEILQLLRALVIEDHNGALTLLPGAPRSWFKPGMHIEMQEAATFHGKVYFKAVWGTVTCVIEWRVLKAPHQDSAPLRLLLPADLDWNFPESARRVGPHMVLELTEPSGRLVFSPLEVSRTEASRAERMRDAVRYQGQIPL
jgi:hypothetical protein